MHYKQLLLKRLGNASADVGLHSTKVTPLEVIVIRARDAYITECQGVEHSLCRAFESVLVTFLLWA